MHTHISYWVRKKAASIFEALVGKKTTYFLTWLLNCQIFRPTNVHESEKKIVSAAIRISLNIMVFILPFTFVPVQVEARIL